MWAFLRDGWVLLVCLLLLVLSFILFVWAYPSHADHISWIDRYQGADGAGCCSHLDCMQATISVLAEDGTTTTVRIGDEEVTLPSKIVRPSEDPLGRAWVCYKAKQVQHENGMGWYSKVYTDASGQNRAEPPDHFTAENTRCVFFVSLN